MGSTKSVVVIGAGPGGLSTALLLAAAGLRVTVLEKNKRPGGRTSALETDGFRFDVGPTFFLYPRVLEDIFSAAGRNLWRETPMARLDPQYRLIFEGVGRINATADLPRMQQEIAAIAPRDAENLPRFMDENRRKLAQFTPCLEKPFESWRDLVNMRMARLLPALRPWNSLDQELKRYFADPRIRLAFSFQSKYLGMSPFRCPGLFSILSFLEYEYGVFHPFGGCARISERMAEIAVEMGVELRLNEPVEEIIFRGNRAVGARTAGGCHSADAVVVNADFAHAMTHLVPDALRRRWTDKKIASSRFSCSTFMLYLGIEGKVADLAHHNILLAEDYRGNLHDIENAHRLTDRPSMYVQNACLTDPSLAPVGCSTLYVLVPVSHQHGNINWAVEKDVFERRVLNRLADLGLKDIAQRIRVKRVCTPADWEGKLSVYRGATFNLAHTLTQMLNLRPHNRFEDLGGVYLVGGGTHPGSGLPVIFESAKITSRLLLEDLGYADAWRSLAAKMSPRPTAGSPENIAACAPAVTSPA